MSYDVTRSPLQARMSKESTSLGDLQVSTSPVQKPPTSGIGPTREQTGLLRSLHNGQSDLRTREQGDIVSDKARIPWYFGSQSGAGEMEAASTFLKRRRVQARFAALAVWMIVSLTLGCVFGRARRGAPKSRGMRTSVECILRSLRDTEGRRRTAYLSRRAGSLEAVPDRA